MTDWSTKAKILYSEKLVTSLDGYAGGLFKRGDSFHPNVQMAYDQKKACGLFLQSNPNLLFDATLNPDHWITSQDYEDVISDVFVGGRWGSKRAIQYIVVDISKTIFNGKKIPVQWVTGYAGWLLDMIWDATKLPVYIYARPELGSAYTGADLIDLQTFLINRANISTISKAVIGENGLPSNLTYPALAFNDAAKCPWYFWLFNILTNGNVEALYWQDQTVFYNDIGFKSGTVVIPPADDPVLPPSGNDPAVTTDAETKAAILEIRDILKRVFKE
jgi:hypothetical protein